MSPAPTCSGCTTPVPRALPGFGLAPSATYCRRCSSGALVTAILAEH